MNKSWVIIRKKEIKIEKIERDLKRQSFTLNVKDCIDYLYILLYPHKRWLSFIHHYI